MSQVLVWPGRDVTEHPHVRASHLRPAPERFPFSTIFIQTLALHTCSLRGSPHLPRPCKPQCPLTFALNSPPDLLPEPESLHSTHVLQDPDDRDDMCDPFRRLTENGSGKASIRGLLAGHRGLSSSDLGMRAPSPGLPQLQFSVAPISYQPVAFPTSQRHPSLEWVTGIKNHRESGRIHTKLS